MSVVVFGLVYLATAVIFAATFRLAGGERTRIFKGVSPGMLPPLGIIFGLFVAFVASQVWSDTDRARAAVNTEANSLSTVIFLSASFPGEPELRMRELTRRHIGEVVTVEWPLMAQRNASSFTVTPAALAEELQFVLALKPQSEGQVTAQRQIVAALEGAMEARRQRIAVSRSRVNWVKWTALILQAVCTLIAVAMVHIDNRGAAVIALWIFATGVAVSILLISSHDRPFSGELSVKPDLLKQVLPEESVTQGAINHTILVHVTSLLRAARQVISDEEDAMAAGKFLTGKELVERAKAKYAEQTGRALPNLDPTSPEGRMLQAEMEAIQEVMDSAQSSNLHHGNFKGVIPAVFTYQVAQRFTGKVGEFAYVKLTAPAELIRHQPNTPDSWENRVIKDKFQSAGWSKGEFVEEVAELNGKKAYRVIIPEYYETSCLACHGEPKGALDITGGQKEGGKLGDLGGAISAAIYLK